MNLTALAELLLQVFGMTILIATGLTLCLILSMEVLRSVLRLFDKS
jgi:hypothetical protein